LINIFIFLNKKQDITSASLAPDRKKFIAGGPADQVRFFFQKKNSFPFFFVQLFAT
jgi:hypothetical protein